MRAVCQRDRPRRTIDAWLAGAVRLVGGRRTPGAVDETVTWECWTGGPAPEDLAVALLDHTDGSDLRAVVAETSSEIVVTLRGPRWQGASPAIGIPVHKRVRLEAPVGARSVVDGATGRRRPRRALEV